MSASVEQVRFDGPAGTLGGEWRAGPGRGAIVAPPHPVYGGWLGHPVVQGLADALAAAGFATLAFDWRGVGASAGRPTGEPDAAVGDYLAALTMLRTRAPGPVVLGGYSFGAAAAAHVAADAADVGGLILVAPPVAVMGPAVLSEPTTPTDVIAGDADDYAPAAQLRALAADRAGVHLALLPGCDHFFVDSPTEPLHEALAAAVARHV
jgi:alpha/beta superfamily hydrolase